jgi:circadian clock protein KaiB
MTMGRFESESEGRYVFRLFVTGSRPRSAAAVATIRAICEEHLPGRYELEVIDVYEQPGLAVEEQVFAMPTLVKQVPAPIRRMIGDLSDREKVLIGLDLQRRE